MPQVSWLKRLIYLALAVSTLGFFLFLALPHEHEKSTFTGHHACQVCKIQKSFSSTPALAGLGSLTFGHVAVFAISFLTTPRNDLLFPSHSSRAPPVLP